MCLNIYIYIHTYTTISSPFFEHLPNPFTKRVPLDQRHHLDVHHRQQRAQPISFHTPRHHRHPASPQLTPLVGFMGSKTCQVSAPFIGKWYHHIRSPEFKKKNTPNHQSTFWWTDCLTKHGPNMKLQTNQPQLWTLTTTSRFFPTAHSHLMKVGAKIFKEQLGHVLLPFGSRGWQPEPRVKDMADRMMSW